MLTTMAELPPQRCGQTLTPDEHRQREIVLDPAPRMSREQPDSRPPAPQRVSAFIHNLCNAGACPSVLKPFVRQGYLAHWSKAGQYRLLYFLDSPLNEVSRPLLGLS